MKIMVKRHKWDRLFGSITPENLKRLDISCDYRAVRAAHDPRKSPVYPGLISRNRSKQWGQLNNILQTLTERKATTT